MRERDALRVLHCAAGNMFGGVETLLGTLARQRALCAGMVPEFAFCFEGRLSAELRAAGVPAHPLGPARTSRPWTVWRARRALRTLVAVRSVDVIVTHGCWPHLMFARPARRAGVPLVYWMHEVLGGRHWVERRAGRTPPDLTLAVSRSAAAHLSRVFPGGRCAVVHPPVVPPGQELAAVRSVVRKCLKVSESATVVIMVSRMERLKGHAVLLDALGRLRDRPDWVAWVVGGAQRPREHAYFDELRAQAGALGLGDRVRFLGARTDVLELLAASDLMCQPNTGPESFGITFVEALYAGLPVVTTRLGGATEIVTDACGRLVPPADPMALAEALARLLDDPDERRRLGAGGPARARALCDPAAVLGRLEGVLRSIINGE